LANSESRTRPIPNDDGYKLSVSRDELSAYLTFTEEDFVSDRADVTAILEVIRRVGIKVGVLESALKDAISNRVVDKPIMIAAGEPPEIGRNACIKYFFRTEERASPKEDEDGRIDYKELDFIQNVVADELLARKTPAEQGKSGESVFGNELAAPAGRDTKLNAGQNTKMSEDGLEIRATAEGSIVFTGNRVSIQETRTIGGSVDSATGNIKCSGSLRIGENINTGFRVDVKGDLEVNGQVHDAKIYCGGNVIVKGGFFGNGSGKIVAEGNITVKWAENQTLWSNGSVHLGGESLNCKIYGKNVVTASSSKSAIVGGEIASKYRIQAPVLGSDAGTPTSLKVAFDADTMRELKKVDVEIERVEDDYARVKEGLTELYKLQMVRKLNPQKEAVLAKLEQFHKRAPGQLKELKTRKKYLESKLKEIKDAAIIGEKHVFQGTKVQFGTIYREIIESMGPTRFEVDYDTIIPAKYSRQEEEARAKAAKRAAATS